MQRVQKMSTGSLIFLAGSPDILPRCCPYRWYVVITCFVVALANFMSSFVIFTFSVIYLHDLIENLILYLINSLSMREDKERVRRKQVFES